MSKEMERLKSFYEMEVSQGRTLKKGKKREMNIPKMKCKNKNANNDPVFSQTEISLTTTAEKEKMKYKQNIQNSQLHKFLAHAEAQALLIFITTVLPTRKFYS